MYSRVRITKKPKVKAEIQGINPRKVKGQLRGYRRMCSKRLVPGGGSYVIPQVQFGTEIQNRTKREMESTETEHV